MDFGDITIHIFLEMLVEWILEFYIISTLMCIGLKKNKNFILKFIIGIFIIIAISYPLAIFYNFFGNSTWGRSLVYLTLFALAIVHHFFCYKEGILKTVLFCDVAYLTQNMIYKLFLILYSVLDVTNAFGGGPTLVTYKIIYYSTFVIMTTAAYFLYIRKIGNSINKVTLPRLILVMSIVTVLVSNVLCSLFDINIEIVQASLGDSSRINVFLVKLSSDLLMILLDSSIVVVFFAYVRRIRLIEDINKMKYVIATSEQQYKVSQETIESINIKCHDMKHKINQIVGDNLSKETLKEVNEAIVIYDSLIDTGNKNLDVILIEKSLICDNHKIAFTKLTEGRALSFLSTGDMFCLFGNILDNAIEATKDLKDENKRYINLTVKKKGEGIVEIECTNYFDKEIEFENELPKTIKKDKSNHGFGVKSIKNIVSKYGGNMKISAKDNVFSIHIILFDSEHIK